MSYGCFYNDEYGELKYFVLDLSFMIVLRSIVNMFSHILNNYKLAMVSCHACFEPNVLVMRV